MVVVRFFLSLVTSCGLRCLATPNCKSFDYNREVGRCVLSDENRASVPDDYTTDDDDNAHSYYELLPDVDLGSVIWTLQDFSPAALSFGARTAALLGSFGDATRTNGVASGLCHASHGICSQRSSC